MQIEKLITMANQVGDFFGAHPDQTLAKKEIASHLKKFWAAPMRQQIIAYAKQQGAGLNPVVLGAVNEYLD